MNNQKINQVQEAIKDKEHALSLLKAQASSLMARISETPKGESRVNLQSRLYTVQQGIAFMRPDIQELREKLKVEHAEAKAARKARNTEKCVVCTLYHAQKGHRYFAAASSPGEVILALHDEAPGWFIISVSHIDPELVEEIPEAMFEMPD
jgi:hypothetical protein